MPTRTRIHVVVMGTLLALATAILAQQHSYTQAEIDAGAKLYESSCGGCHGENGDRITGIDFSKATFKTARTDDDLIRIIRNGVPNTGMPGNPFSETQANTIVAFVRSMPGGRLANASVIGSLTGDPARGKTIVEGKGNCASCHPTNGVGGNSGPDLAGQAGGRGGRGAAGAAAAVPAAPGGGAGAPAAGAPPAGGGAGRGARGGQAGAPRGGAPAAGAPAAAAAAGGGRGGRGVPTPQQLERSLLDPSAEMAAEYRIYQVVTKANVTARGTLLNQDTFSVQMRDNTDKLMSYWKQDLKDYGFLPSPMPSYRNTLTPQEIADVVSYLVSLRSN